MERDFCLQNSQAIPLFCISPFFSSSSSSSSSSLSCISMYHHLQRRTLPNVLDASNHALEKVSLSKPFMGSSNDETESCNPPGQLIFEYFEHETPYNCEPLADKISDLARQFPELL